MNMTLNGRDGYEQCPDCHRPVWASNVAGHYNPAEMLAWWISAVCKDCQRLEGADLHVTR